jgi:hypothetical protein
MPDWLKELLLAVIGSASITGGIGWWFKTRRDDRIARDLAHAEREQAALKEAREAQQEVKAMLQDRIKYEMVRGDSSDLTGRVLNELAARQREFMQMLPAMATRQQQMLEAVTDVAARLQALERAIKTTEKTPL